jgi:hypothetical protein
MQREKPDSWNLEYIYVLPLMHLVLAFGMESITEFIGESNAHDIELKRKEDKLSLLASLRWLAFLTTLAFTAPRL